MKKIIVTGGTGFVGEKLCLELARKGYQLTLLTRDPQRAAKKLQHPYQFIKWDSRSPLPPSVIEGAFAVVHLAGESVAAHRWNEKVKREIHDSRTVSTGLLAEAINRSAAKPAVFIGASGTGAYGDRGSEVLTEKSHTGDDFLANVCRDWENAYLSAASRNVILRTGMVLGNNGGALKKLLPPFRMGVGGKIGSGNQWMSWIHLDDLVNLYIFALENEKLSGIVNAVAPEPVTNSEFTKTLGSILRRPCFFGVPLAALRLALGEMTGALFASQRAIPKAAMEAGFSFRFPELKSALRNLLVP